MAELPGGSQASLEDGAAVKTEVAISRPVDVEQSNRELMPGESWVLCPRKRRAGLVFFYSKLFEANDYCCDHVRRWNVITDL